MIEGQPSMLVDFEHCWLALRAELTAKSGHGTFGPDGLLARMAKLEVEFALEEGPTEQTLRLFGVQVSEDLLKIAEAATGESANGLDPSQSDRNDSRGASPNGHTHSQEAAARH